MTRVETPPERTLWLVIEHGPSRLVVLDFATFVQTRGRDTRLIERQIRAGGDGWHTFPARSLVWLFGVETDFCHLQEATLLDSVAVNNYQWALRQIWDKSGELEASYRDVLRPKAVGGV